MGLSLDLFHINNREHDNLFLTKKIIKDNKAIMEGIVIGVVSGLILSYVTDVNFQAKINLPFIKIGKLFNSKVQYVSKDWAGIKINQYNNETGIVSVEATNIASGVTVKIADKPISSLPADLRFDMYEILKAK